MDFNVFKSKKKKSEPKEPASEPKAPAPAPSQPAAPSSAPKPPPQEASPSRGPRPSMARGAYMDELDCMSRVPGMRNFEVTTSRTFRWNLRDPVDGRDYEYYYQDQGPPMAYWGAMQRPRTRYVARALPPQPPQQLLGPPPGHQYGPPGPLVAPPHPCHGYGYGGAPSAYGYRRGDSYYEDEYPQDCDPM